MAKIKLYPNTTNTLTGAKRVPAHVSSVVAPISYVIQGDLGIADPNAASVYVGIPHKFSIVEHVSVTPLNSPAITGAPYVASKEYVITGEAIGADYVANATTLTLSANAPSTADTLIGFYIRIDSGDNSGEIRKIIDYAADVVTLESGFDYAMTSGTETYTILGTALLMTVDPNGAPTYSVSVTGRD